MPTVRKVVDVFRGDPQPSTRPKTDAAETEREAAEAAAAAQIAEDVATEHHAAPARAAAGDGDGERNPDTPSGEAGDEPPGPRNPADADGFDADAGTGRAADVSLSADGTAAPFIPGGSVVSAATSGVDAS
jgi:hypothetical protein